jgi:Reverse transcriptase (RNA-dependent DNA polymerase)
MVGIQKREFHVMGINGVWNIFPLSSMPYGRKLVCNRWFYTEKDDETHRSWCVAQGFSQVPGKDFTYSHAPLLPVLACRMTLIFKIPKELRSGKIYIDTAFLNSELDEEIYKRLPDGYVMYMLEVHYVTLDPTTHVLLLKKGIYWLVQVDRQCWKMFYTVMAKCDF